MNQVIIFINPTKFYGLLGDDTATSDRVGFTKVSAKGYSHLNGGKSLFYVSSDGMKAGEYNSRDAAEAIFIFVPDTLKFPFSPAPDSKFVVLHHSETPLEQVSSLRGFTGHFKGARKSYEDPDTVYDDLARQIRSGSINLGAIWAKLSDETLTEIAAKEEFLSEISSGKPLTSVKLPDALARFENDYNKFRESVSGKFDLTNQTHSDLYNEFLAKLK
jgi:hypothetical protein